VQKTFILISKSRYQFGFTKRLKGLKYTSQSCSQYLFINIKKSQLTSSYSSTVQGKKCFLRDFHSAGILEKENHLKRGQFCDLIGSFTDNMHTYYIFFT